MSNLAKVFLTAVLVLGINGCAAILFDADENVTFSSVPDAAEIRLNGMPVGRTPQMLNIEAHDYVVEFRREGCDPVTMELDSSTSGGAVATSVIFGLFVGGPFELLSLVEGTGIYRNLPDTCTANLVCREPEK